MQLLLDTHSFIWWSINSEKLSLTGQDLLFDRNNRLFLSVASVWEMQIKLQLGKLQLNPSLQELIKNQITINNLEILSIDLAHIWTLATLIHYHKDPFDRLLISQSITEIMPILSIDEIFDLYPVQRIW
ncbi:MAG: type II toxin-antitoxin system VapC family toxin [Microcystis panniformis Mp_MB_F_20051200_S9]|jgi:PIN domain nuclease of toxin-antitoxin system|uniref:Type II toxin-antitoxin system VapC family toxin n=1 Tax=Microcystis panniformis Mp_MB_F_20051200_S9 TaxID=2486223 RepID=A0A552PYQ1_9CHRO|nr:MAG: type II toxin-antitoxin system VapC family toxin [Microcystis panniformis Mp_GB_SS_20050300_S99D]TRV46820.1 MAG: type II toxin-antitoxin system VapC family toxin [Microcystis panniformis Mp_GB_SS_20050300_S99]TRV51861.1 MAG: type II toxin-antitoxin system VapC family toxin [Microcystis panniformis Mp_MB_F_20080800_S26D]TRV62103.1 MAG: type II toxin-antitoxin system VapC family toxin [Microcystis panniformis Mp_MB_F_20051200_S9]TRV63355.1 MAG: type II toxin-antitoxin system VapC family t